MAKITYIETDGTARQVDVMTGVSVAEGAISNAVPGIEGDCGGGCACATCHIYVADEWAARLNPPDELETLMLGFAFDVQPSSRLACQIKVSDTLDGLTVHTPMRQY
ncbi:MAG: 2Fe-2S iron-sulfur cluster-binding protein [Pseudomonadota bacterium]